MTRSATERFAEFLVGIDATSIPPDVLDDARWRVLDTIGVALAGSRMDYAAGVMGVAAEMAGRGEATTIASGLQSPATTAGLVNGTLAHGPDFDDTHSDSMVHISTVVVPAGLAMGERVGASGRECLVAIVAGAEVGLRIGAAAADRFHRRGYHSTSVCGPFAAAATSAVLLRLDVEQSVNALGLVGSQAGGLLQALHDGSWVRRLHAGWSVQAGLMAALLAQRGMTGPVEVLEGRAGLYNVLLHGEPAPTKLAPLSADIGTRWLYPETTFKPYPNAAWTHASMEGLARVMRRDDLSASDIARIDCTVPDECVDLVCEPRDVKLRPRTPYHMKTSLPYALAMQAVLGDVTVDSFTDSVLADRDIAALAARVHCHSDPMMSPTTFPARVTVATHDGGEYEADVPAQMGNPANPMSGEGHRRKFRSCASPSLGQDATEELMEAIGDILDVGHLTTELMALTRARPS